jgi:TolB-like protein/Tfp pilus assembly protein PilF
VKTWVQEARRRGVFKVAAVYVVGAWLVMQVADVFFPAWDIPDAALRSLLAAAIMGFPIALLFGWRYDITLDGIKRTPTADAETLTGQGPLGAGDYVTLALLFVATGAILYTMAGNIRQSQEKDTVASAAPPNSIAVLPFMNISDDPSNDYFCDGISEEILHRLGAYRDMQVMARVSSFAFKGTDTAPERMAEALGVRYLLQGSVRKSEDNLRISASLVDASGYQLWSETFDRKLTGVFAIQTEIAESVVSRLAETLLESYVSREIYEPDIDAYQAFLIGREYLHNRTPSFQQNALESFDRAIANDPKYPDAHAGRAIALILLTRIEVLREEELLLSARESIDTALALDPQLPIGRAALGLWLDVAERDYVAAEAEIRAALEADPTNANAANWLIRVLDLQGRVPEVMAQRELALERDPLNPILTVNLARELKENGDFYRAEKILRRLLELPTPPVPALASLHTLYTDYGRFVDAVTIGKELGLTYAGQEGRQGMLGILSLTYAQLGMWEEAYYWQDFIESALPGNLFELLRRSLLQKYEGNQEGMVQLLAQIAEQHAEDPRTLPFIAKLVVAAMNVDVADRALGIELFESAYGPDLEKLTLRVAGIGQAFTAAQRAAGNTERADEIFAAIADLLQFQQDRGKGQSPSTLFQIAQNHASVGNRSAAIYGLEKAIEAGWRDYYFVRNDNLMWNQYEGEPRFEELMNRVLEDLERQRLEVEKADRDGDFRAQIEALTDG